MINKINKERRRSMNATPTRPINKSKWQGAQEDPKQKRHKNPILAAIFTAVSYAKYFCATLQRFFVCNQKHIRITYNSIYFIILQNVVNFIKGISKLRILVAILAAILNIDRNADI
jgi:hypothetical protein